MQQLGVSQFLNTQNFVQDFIHKCLNKKPYQIRILEVIIESSKQITCFDGS
jgi:hypothetical protein